MNWLKKILGGEEKKAEQAAEPTVHDVICNNAAKNDLLKRVSEVYDSNEKITKNAGITSLVEEDRKRHARGLSATNLASALTELSLIDEGKSVMLEFRNRYPDMLDLVMKNREKAEKKLLSYAPYPNFMKKAERADKREGDDKFGWNPTTFKESDKVVEDTKSLNAEDKDREKEHRHSVKQAGDKSIEPEQRKHREGDDKFGWNPTEFKPVDAIERQKHDLVKQDKEREVEHRHQVKQASYPAVWSVQEINGVESIVKLIADPYESSADPSGISFSLLSSIGVIKNGDVVEVHSGGETGDYVVAGFNPFAEDGRILKLARVGAFGIEDQAGAFLSGLAQDLALKDLNKKSIVTRYGPLSDGAESDVKIEKTDKGEKYHMDIRIRGGKANIQGKEYTVHMDDCDITVDSDSYYVYVMLPAIQSSKERAATMSEIASVKCGIENRMSKGMFSSELPERTDAKIAKIVTALRKHNIAVSSDDHGYMLARDAYVGSGDEGLKQELTDINPTLPEDAIMEITVAFCDEPAKTPEPAPVVQTAAVPAEPKKEMTDDALKEDEILSSYDVPTVKASLSDLEHTEIVVLAHLVAGHSLRRIASELGTTPADVFLSIEKVIKPKVEKMANMELSRHEFVKFAAGVFAGTEQKKDDSKQQVPGVFRDIDQAYTPNRPDGGEIQGANKVYPEKVAEVKPVIVNEIQKTEVEWVCPHCSANIGEKSLFLDDKKVWHHRACGGEILLPKKAEKTVMFNETNVKEYNNADLEGKNSAKVVSESPEGVTAKTEDGKDVVIKKEDVVELEGSKSIEITEPITGKLHKFTLTASDGKTDIHDSSGAKVGEVPSMDEEEIKAYLTHRMINK